MRKGKIFLRFLCLYLVSLVFVSCATLPAPEIPYAAGYREKGVASWYGIPFHGRKTANGDVYDMYKMTAAHRLMPLGTTVRVTNLKNGRSVRVLVNDRGPFIRGRTLDLSFGAAKRLKMVQAGTAPVAIEVISPPKNNRKSSAS
ncbi:MAG TPA: septal ring lytic transglycosylase RlpA family protein, partial [Nitrospiria bacterium]|nr:septal ring lytic transglycosylase RlpA family protein [Nitrospiria bacterium]